MTTTEQRRYFILFGRNVETGKHELIFGDYDREVVEDEREDVMECGMSPYDNRTLTIRRTSDKQADIDAAIATLNA